MTNKSKTILDCHSLLNKIVLHGLILCFLPVLFPPVCCYPISAHKSHPLDGGVYTDWFSDILQSGRQPQQCGFSLSLIGTGLNNLYDNTSHTRRQYHRIA